MPGAQRKTAIYLYQLSAATLATEEKPKLKPDIHWQCGTAGKGYFAYGIGRCQV